MTASQREREPSASAAGAVLPAETPLPPADGARAVWWTAGVVGAVFAALLLWYVLTPRDFYTGTNSVEVRSIVATVQPGQRLCLPRLAVPAGTGRVRFAAFGQRPQLDATVRMTVAGRTTVAKVSGRPRPDNRVNLDAALPQTPKSPASLPGSVCLTPRGGPFDIGGMIGLQGDQQPAHLDGKPLANRISVWFLPPAGQQRSLLQSLGPMLSRAALFRPGIVGRWTYVLLLFLVLPLTIGAALWLMARAAAGRRTRIAPGLVVALIAFTNAASWALITPAFDAPDEPDHFAYAQYLAETGHQPQQVAGDSAFSSDETLGMDAMRVYSVVEAGDARPPWLRADERRWEVRRAAMAHPTDDGGGYTTSAAPHRPLYYGLLSPAYALVSSQSVFTQLTAMRLVSALLGALVALCAFGIVRELLPRHRLAAAAAGLLVAFHPMFTFIAGAVNNDNGVNAGAALSLYLVIRGLRRGPSWRLLLALGAALALTPLMKGTGFEIYPAILVGVLGMAWRHRRDGGVRAWAALAGGFAATRLGWVLLAPVFQRPAEGGGGGGGGISATGAVSGALHMPKRYLEYLWQVFLPRLGFMPDLFPQHWPFYDIYLLRGWGAFGWYAIAFPSWVYYAILGAMIAVGALGIAAVAGARASAWRLNFELVVIALVPICVVLAVEAAYFTPVGGRAVEPEQGRYMFPAIAALAVIAVGGTFGLGRRWHVPLATALVVAMIGLSCAARLVAMGGFYT